MAEVAAHPWHAIPDDWNVEFVLLGAGVFAETDIAAHTIYIDKRLGQAERRSSLQHELMHVYAGHDGEQGDDIEAQVEQEAARALISLDDLLRVLPWAANRAEAAEELWVDVDLLRARLDHLHPSELAAIKRAFAQRDNTDDHERH